MINFNKKLLVLATTAALSSAAIAMEEMSADMASPYATNVNVHAPTAVADLATELHDTLRMSMMTAMASTDTTTMTEPI